MSKSSQAPPKPRPIPKPLRAGDPLASGSRAKSEFQVAYRGEKWTRVLVATQSLELESVEHGVGEDLDALVIKPKVRGKPWRPLYQNAGSSNVVTKQNLAEHRLSREQLFAFALQIQAVRSKILKEVEKSTLSQREIELAAQQVRKDHQSEYKATRMQLSAWESSYYAAPPRRKAVKRMSDYSWGEKIAMLR